MIVSSHRKFLLLLLLSIILAGCGFQLRQSATLPASFGPVKISGIDQYSTVYRSLRNALSQSSIRIVSDSSAQHEITINPSQERKVLSVNAAGKVSEYELIQRIRYQVSGSDGKTVVPSTNLTFSTYYRVSGSEILGDDREEADLFQRLEERLINQMLDQISAAL